jgi:hypothetical protein
MTNKTIYINPNLFTLGGSKSKKNREKKQKPNTTPLISPNVLKNKLLKRIKEHKNRETENLVNNKKKLNNETNESDNKDEIKTFTDEFSDSINYLQTLSKQKKINDEKNIYEKNKLKRKEELERKTIKNYNSLNENAPYVNLDLPEELQITNIDHSINPIIEPIQIKTHLDNIPYGVLKGGTKPTYRDWSRTYRNNIVTNPNNALVIEPGELNRVKNNRETHLDNLRKKLKLKELSMSVVIHASYTINIAQEWSEYSWWITQLIEEIKQEQFQKNYLPLIVRLEDIFFKICENPDKIKNYDQIIKNIKLT